MLFSTLDTLKRKMVMMIIFFLFTGLTMFVIPVSSFAPWERLRAGSRRVEMKSKKKK